MVDSNLYAAPVVSPPLLSSLTMMRIDVAHRDRYLGVIAPPTRFAPPKTAGSHSSSDAVRSSKDAPKTAGAPRRRRRTTLRPALASPTPPTPPVGGVAPRIMNFHLLHRRLEDPRPRPLHRRWSDPLGDTPPPTGGTTPPPTGGTGSVSPVGGGVVGTPQQREARCGVPTLETRRCGVPTLETRRGGLSPAAVEFPHWRHDCGGRTSTVEVVVEVVGGPPATALPIGDGVLVTAPPPGLPAPDSSPLPAPDSSLPAPGSTLPAPGSTLPAPGSNTYRRRHVDTGPPVGGLALPAPGSNTYQRRHVDTAPPVGGLAPALPAPTDTHLLLRRGAAYRPHLDTAPPVGGLTYRPHLDTAPPVGGLLFHLLDARARSSSRQRGSRAAATMI